jgi:hypothetical protein
LIYTSRWELIYHQSASLEYELDLLTLILMGKVPLLHALSLVFCFPETTLRALTEECLYSYDNHTANTGGRELRLMEMWWLCCHISQLILVRNKTSIWPQHR